MRAIAYPYLCAYLAVLLILTACVPAQYLPEPPATQPLAQPYTFYLFDPFGENELMPLDPETLNEQLEGKTTEPGRAWILSADGSTMVNVERDPNRKLDDLKADEMWIVVHDLQTGSERARFHPPAPAFPFALSDDGGRLVLDPNSGRYPSPAEWYVVDTIKGQQLLHLLDVDHACQRSWYDSAGRQRIYCLVDRQGEGVQPIKIIAYDVESEAKSGELELPEVLAGGRETDQIVNNQSVWAFLEPAVALSPDGQRLAVVHADTDRVTLIHAQNLAIEGTFLLMRPASLLDRLLELFAPAVAHAKGEMEGTIRHAVFSPDGRYLYVFSQEIRVSLEDAPARRGLWLVDLEQDTIVAEALLELQIQWVRPAPDGSVYVFGTTDKRLLPYEIRPTSPSTLWRLDVPTLETLAKREFTGYRGSRLVLVQPAK